MDFSENREKFWKNIRKHYYTTNTGRVSRDLIVDFVKSNNISSILELGCNSGGNLLAISKSLPDVRLVGLDICERAIEYGREVEKNPADLLVGSIYDLSRFDDDSFDLVFTRGVLLHTNHEKMPIVVKDMLRISNKYVFHMEQHGEPKIRSYSKKIPHSFSHDFNRVYSNFGIVPKITDVGEIIDRPPVGGADHFILAEVKSPELLFVVGGFKSGTTTLMGMLNCHKDIYLEGELFGHKKSMNRFRQDYPEVVSICSMSGRPRFYTDYIKYIENSRGLYNYKYVGEKIATLSSKDLWEVKDSKVIFICRDIRTWLAKPALPRIPICRGKVWPTQFAVEYTSLLINSFGLPRCFCLKMEDMLGDNTVALQQIGKFIDMPLETDISGWWRRMGKYNNTDDPKGKMEWWIKQPSSLVGPSKTKRDLVVSINEQHPVWKAVLPIFDKYYNNMGEVFEDGERERDLEILSDLELLKTGRLDLYKHIKGYNIAKKNK
jgi:SAM-dependent methyltransferase